MLRIITKKRLDRLENRILEQKVTIERRDDQIAEYELLKRDVEYYCRNNGLRLIKHIKPKEKFVPFVGCQSSHWSWEIIK